MIATLSDMSVRITIISLASVSAERRWALMIPFFPAPTAAGYAGSGALCVRYCRKRIIKDEDFRVD